jgi:hypothetical protein
MPAIKRTVDAAAENALEGLKFSVLNSPALVSLYASSGTAGNSLSFSIGDRDILVDAAINLEVRDRTIDTSVDALLIQEAVPAGKMYLNLPTPTTDITYQIVIEPLG